MLKQASVEPMHQPLNLLMSSQGEHDDDGSDRNDRRSDESQREEWSMGVLGDLSWYYMRSGGALVFGVITFPLHLVGNILSSLAGVVSSLFFPLRLRSNAHEPLQRRLTRLEEEVRKWKPLQDFIPKELNPQPVAAMGDHSQKLSFLETELANTRKLQIGCLLLTIIVKACYRR